MRFFPGGVVWGWSLLIPAFAWIGDGVGQYLRLKEQQQFPPQYQRPQFDPARETPAVPPSPQTPEISAPTTSELTNPPSVTEQTTKHLDASRKRE
jgi:hypothetical protein